MIGRVADGLSVLSTSREEAAKYWYENGDECPSSVIANRAAEHAQLSTQHAGMRPLGVTLLFASMELMDDGKYLPQLFKVDPSGYCFPQYAAATGQKETELVNDLERRLKHSDKHFKEQSYEEVARAGISALQTVMRQHFKARDIEVGLVCEEHKEFTIVPEDIVERWLTDITENA